MANDDSASSDSTYWDAADRPDDGRSASEVIAGWDDGISGSVVQGERVIHVEHVWTTAITLELPHCGDRTAQALAAIARCVEFFAHVDEVFSTFRPLSEATLYRNGLMRPGAMSADFAEVMAGAQQARALSAGAFDPWAMPGGYDPLGYVKGWAAGRAGALLGNAGFPDHMVNAGGDVVAHGDQHEPGTGWRVGVVNPHSGREVVAMATLQDQAMATSGTYERGQHVLNPWTGRAAAGVDSATVIGPDAGLVDALASAALVSGLDTVNWFGGLGPGWSLFLVAGQTTHAYGPAFSPAPAPDGQ